MTRVCVELGDTLSACVCGWGSVCGSMCMSVCVCVCICVATINKHNLPTKQTIRNAVQVSIDLAVLGHFPQLILFHFHFLFPPPSTPLLLSPLYQFHQQLSAGKAQLDWKIKINQHARLIVKSEDHPNVSARYICIFALHWTIAKDKLPLSH